MRKILDQCLVEDDGKRIPYMLFFASLILIILDCLVLRQRTAAAGTVCGFPFVATEFLRDHQYPLHAQKSMGPHELIPEC